MGAKHSRGVEVAVFVFAASFIFAAFYYLPYAIDTGIAWILTAFATFGFGLILRWERLQTTSDYAILKDKNTLSVAQFSVLAFIAWAILNFVWALMEHDGIEPESRWMTFIATMMGVKWSMFLTNAVKRVYAIEGEGQSRHALLSPSNDIA